MACSDEELNDIAKLLEQEKLGESVVTELNMPDDQTIASHAATMKKAGIFGNYRTARAVWGDQFGVNAINPTIRNNIKAENFSSEYSKKFNAALEPLELGRFRWLPREQDEQLAKALELVDKDGRFFGPPGSLPAPIVKTAQNIRVLYNELFEKFGIDPDTYITGYRPLIKDRSKGIFREPTNAPTELRFRSRLSPNDIIFYHELERKGNLLKPDPTASNGFAAYVHGLANAKIRAPFLEELEKTYVNKAFGVKMTVGNEGELIPIVDDFVGHKMWTEYRHHLLGGPTPDDIKFTYTTRRLVRMFGKEMEEPDAVRAAYQWSHGITTAFYTGALGSPIGGRPASVIRQLFQLVPTYAELGGKYTMQGIAKAFEPGAIDALRAKNMLTSHIENLTQSISIARGVGRVVSQTSEYFLKAFSAVDQFTRVATAYGAEAKFNDYVSRGLVEKLSMRREMKEEFLRLVKGNKMDEAKDAYMFDTVANLQYIYGKANRPEAFRGALGNMLGVLMSYPLNTAELIRIFAKRAVPERYGGGGDPAPLIRLVVATNLILMGGSEMLNADLRSAAMVGALPYSMPIANIGIDAAKFGITSANWLSGNTYGIGVTDYQKHIHEEAKREFIRDFQAFVPGGLFIGDIFKAIDEGSLVRMLALTPKADVLNREAKRRAVESRETTGLPGIRGIR